jgi:hypothetical protein
MRIDDSVPRNPEKGRRMKVRQIKRDRPNLQTAHKFFEEGSFSVDPVRHYTSKEEREAEIQIVVDDLESITKQFPRTQKLEYALLKGHLIIEHALMQYIRMYSTVSVAQKDIRFGFIQKLGAVDI